MSGRLKGKVALITGAASGIGLGTLELFVAEGTKVVAADLQDEKGRMLEQRFPSAVRYARCDVTREADIASAVSLAEREFFWGARHPLQQRRRRGRPRQRRRGRRGRLGRDFALLVRGPAVAMKHALPLMQQRGAGSVINTASVAGLQAGFGPLAYSSAKAAVIHMSRTAATALARHKIRVNAICPGLIATSIFGAARGLTREVADQMAAQIVEFSPKVQPISKAGLPDDIGKAVLFLASDDSEFVTRTHIVVDGGITIGGRHAWDPTAVSPFAAMFGSAATQSA